MDVINGACPSSTSRATMPSVRVSCQVIARASGTPVCRFQITVVSRWLAMPRPTRSSGVRPALFSAAGTTRVTLRQISSASCSTRPGRG
jgi:hypothetical protein